LPYLVEARRASTTDNGFALVLPYANTEAMQQFLNHFAATIGKEEHAVMVLDQAGWYDSRALCVPANLTLVPLPAYSPELNPVERIWLYLKERFLSHRLHNEYEAIVDAACKAWKRLTAEAGRIKSLCTYPWIPKVKRSMVLVVPLVRPTKRFPIAGPGFRDLDFERLATQ
jgi:transposase